MLPEFPKFKQLELSDRKDIESRTQDYPPYSDFNFISMWTWDTRGEVRVSQYKKNLVVRFNDYIDERPFYSFLGSSDVSETAIALLDLSQEEKLEPVLRLIPEVTAKNLDENLFVKNEDRANFDYIYDLHKISELKGKSFETKRNQINRFTKRHSNISSKILDLSHVDTRSDLIKLSKVWKNHKLKLDKPDEELDFNELVALKRAFYIEDDPSIIGIGVYSDQEMVAFSIDQISDLGHSVAHFAKANRRYVGIYDYLMRESAKVLLKKGCMLLNYEQDLGLSALRHAKSSYRPVAFLRKYVVQCSGENN